MGEHNHPVVYPQPVVYPLLEDRRVGRDGDLEAKGNSGPMSSELWANLPTEILERVLWILPAEAQNRLQLVCRTWRLLLTSPGFREASTSRALADRRRPCLLWGYPASLVIADHPRPVDLSFLPAKFSGIWRFYRSSYFGFYSSDFSWVTSAKEDGHLLLCLVNLEKRTCTELPPLSLRPLAAADYQLQVESVGKVVQEPWSSSFFHITVLLRFWYSKVVTVARYSSRGGVWTTSQLDLATPPSYRFCHALLYQGSRVQVIYARIDRISPHIFWQLASFSIENTGAGDALCLARGCLPRSSLPESCMVSKDCLVAHKGGIFCTRLGADSSMRTTISIFSWSLVLKKNCKYGDEYVSDMVPVSVLTAQQLDPVMDPEMRVKSVQVRPQVIDNKVLILITGHRGPRGNQRAFVRVMGYDIQKKSWLRLVF